MQVIGIRGEKAGNHEGCPYDRKCGLLLVPDLLDELGDWHTWGKRHLEPEEILRMNREAIMPNWNQFFDEIRADKTGIGEVVDEEAIA